MSARVTWSGTKQVELNMRTFNTRVTSALKKVAQYWAGVFEAYAKEHASWVDRTGSARQSLHTWVQELANDTVRLYLSHGVEHGLYLEVRYAGKYAIIWRTIEAHLPQINQMLRGIFR